MRLRRAFSGMMMMRMSEYMFDGDTQRQSNSRKSGEISMLALLSAEVRTIPLPMHLYSPVYFPTS